MPSPLLPLALALLAGGAGIATPPPERIGDETVPRDLAVPKPQPPPAPTPAPAPVRGSPAPGDVPAPADRAVPKPVQPAPTPTPIEHASAPAVAAPADESAGARTIVAGVALSAACVGAGMWLVSRRRAR